jgi:hypothetical protein
MDLGTETSTQITITITPKIFQLHFKYHCTVQHTKSSHDELSVAIFHRELFPCHLNTQTRSNTPEYSHGVHRALRSNGLGGGTWRHLRKRRGHVTPTYCCAFQAFTELSPSNAPIQSATLPLSACPEASVAQHFLHRANTPQYNTSPATSAPQS